ncbi:MAG: hypothetical protein ABL866_08600 [Devosia sp.]
MKVARLALFVILVLLSISTGVTKLVQLPAEMQLFQNAGWGVPVILAFGVLQLAGGLMLIWPPSRRYGAVVMIATFAVASAVVFINGLMAFFAFSLLFIVLAILPLLPDGPERAA